MAKNLQELLDEKGEALDGALRTIEVELLDAAAE